MNKIFITIILFILVIILIVEKKKRLIYQCKSANDGNYKLFYKKIKKLTNNLYGDKYLHKITFCDDNSDESQVYNDKIDGIIVLNPKKEKFLLFCHGNACNISDLFHYIEIFYPYTSIVLFDYRSYGKSYGPRPNEKIIKQNVLSVWNYLTQNMNIDPLNITIMGESLGSAVAIWLASFLYFNYGIMVNAVISQSGFSSLSDMIPSYFPINILKLFVIGEYDSMNNIKSICKDTKILISHSQNDEMIPYEHGLNLYNSVKKTHNIYFYTLNGDHNNIIFDDSYIKTIINFIE